MNTSYDEAAYVGLVLDEAKRPDPALRNRLATMVQEASRHFMSGVLSPDGYTAILNAVDARKRREHAAMMRRGSIGEAATRVASVYSLDPEPPPEPTEDASATKPRPVRVVRTMTPEERIARDQRLARRRFVAKCGRIPASIAQHFTVGEQAVLGQVALQAKLNSGDCTLAVDALAQRAKVCRRVVQNALRRAFAAGFLVIFRRKRATNLIRLAASKWVEWNRRSRNEKTQSVEENKGPSKGAEACEPRTAEQVEAVRVEAEVAAAEAVTEARRQWAEERAKQGDVATVRASRSDWHKVQDADPWRAQWPHVVAIADQHLTPEGDLTDAVLHHLVDRLEGRFSFRFQSTRSPGGVVVDRPVVGLRDHWDAMALKLVFG